jgi:hypothetical protein
MPVPDTDMPTTMPVMLVGVNVVEVADAEAVFVNPT